MTRSIRMAGALALLATPISIPAWADNIAACDAVIMVDLENGAAAMASFRDASEFIGSVMAREEDDSVELVTQIDGFDIAALMCTRRSPIPKIADMPLIRSGVPFVLSTDFDSADAPTVNIALDGQGRAFPMMAAGLTPDQEAALMAYLDAVPPVTPDSENEPAMSMDAK